MWKLRELVRILVVALLWFSSAYLAVGALVPPAALPCALLNLMIGCGLVLYATRTRRGARLFYQHPREKEEGWILIGLIWALPFPLFFLGFLWWIGRWLWRNLP